MKNVLNHRPSLVLNGGGIERVKDGYQELIKILKLISINLIFLTEI